jgi:Cu/Ag efflux pump CusA
MTTASIPRFALLLAIGLSGCGPEPVAAPEAPAAAIPPRTQVAQASADARLATVPALVTQRPGARVGSDELGLDPMGLNETDSFLVLKPRGEWRGDKPWLVNALRRAMEAGA